MELSQIRAPKFLTRKTRWILGADLGQAADPTAICALEHQTGVMDSGSDYERHTGLPTEQKPAEKYSVRYLERLPLGTPYPSVVRHIGMLLARPPLCGDANMRPAALVIDASGVGAGVADMFSEAGMKPVRIKAVHPALTRIYGPIFRHGLRTPMP